MGLIRNCILISLFSVHLPFAVSIGHSVHRLVILKMSLIGTFLVISLYPFTWILPNILRWVFFMHTTNYPSFSFPFLVSCIIFAKTFSKICFLIVIKSNPIKMFLSQVAYKMGMLSKAGYSLVGVGRLP